MTALISPSVLASLLVKADLRVAPTTSPTNGKLWRDNLGVLRTDGSRELVPKPLNIPTDNSDYLAADGTYKPIPAPDLSSKVSKVGDIMTGALVTPSVKFGGATSSYGMWTGTNDQVLRAKLADDSGFASIECDWNIVRSTLLLGTSTPSSYGRMTYQSNSWQLRKQDTTYAKLTLGSIELNNAGVAGLNLTSTGSYGQVDSGTLDLNLVAGSGRWVTMYSGSTALLGARGSGYDAALFNGLRLGFETGASGIGDIYIGRASAGVLGVYSERSGVGNTLGDTLASKHRVYNVAGNSWIEAHSNSGIRVYNASGNLGIVYSHECSVDATGYFYVSGRGIINSSANGVIHVQNYNFDDVTANQALAFGPATSSSNGVRLKRVMGTATLELKNGNDSAYADFKANKFIATGYEAFTTPSGWNLMDYGGNSFAILQGANTYLQLGANGNPSTWITPSIMFGPHQYTPYAFMKMDVASTFKFRNAADNGWAQLQTGDVIIDRAAGANAILRFTEAGGLKSQFLSRGSDQAIELLNYDGSGELRLYQGGAYKLVLGANGVVMDANISSTTAGHTDTFTLPGNATAQFKLTNDGGSMGFHHHYYPAQQIDRWVWRVTPNATYIGGGAKHFSVGYLYNQANVETDMGLQFSTAAQILVQTANTLTWNFQTSANQQHWINNGGGASEISMHLVSNTDWAIKTGYGGTSLLRVQPTIITAGVPLSLYSGAPATSSSPGVAGTITWDATYLYGCISTNSWKRIAWTTF